MPPRSRHTASGVGRATPCAWDTRAHRGGVTKGIFIAKTSCVFSGVLELEPRNTPPRAQIPRIIKTRTRTPVQQHSISRTSDAWFDTEPMSRSLPPCRRVGTQTPGLGPPLTGLSH